MNDEPLFNMLQQVLERDMEFIDRGRNEHIQNMRNPRHRLDVMDGLIMISDESDLDDHLSIISYGEEEPPPPPAPNNDPSRVSSNGNVLKFNF